MCTYFHVIICLDAFVGGLWLAACNAVVEMSTLMNEKNLEIKAANASLVSIIARLLGKEALLQHAQAISPAAERKMEQCLSGR